MRYSETDLFGTKVTVKIKEKKRKKPLILVVDEKVVFTPATVQKIDRLTALTINHHSAHLFR